MSGCAAATITCLAAVGGQINADPHGELTLSLGGPRARLGWYTDTLLARAEAERIRALRRTFADLHQEAWAHPGDADVRRRLATMAADLDRPDLEQVWLEAAAAVEAGRKPAANRQ